MNKFKQPLHTVLLVPKVVSRPDSVLLLVLAPATLLNAVTTQILGHAAIHLPCLITLVTGHRCPGCGLTRALTQLWLGHLHQAVELNPLSPLVLALLLILFFQQVRRLVVYQRQIFQPQPATQP